MRLTPLAMSCAAIVGTLALSVAGPAAADFDLMGTYTFAAKNGESATWTLSPCTGNAAGCVRVSETGNSKHAPWTADAHLSVGSWIMFVDQSDAIPCEGGTAAAGRKTYSWDAVGLSGNASSNTGGACGTKPGTLSVPFTLTMAGGAPIPALSQPADTGTGAAPASAPPAGPLPAPLPAESPVAAGPAPVSALTPPG